VRVLRRPLVTIAVLFVLDYLVWLWSLGGSRGAIGMVAGPLLVLLAVALAGLLVKRVWQTVTAASRHPRAADRRTSGAGSMRYRDSRAAMPATPESGAPPDHDGQETATSGSPASSAQIAA